MERIQGPSQRREDTRQEQVVITIARPCEYNPDVGGRRIARLVLKDGAGTRSKIGLRGPFTWDLGLSPCSISFF